MLEKKKTIKISHLPSTLIQDKHISPNYPRHGHCEYLKVNIRFSVVNGLNHDVSAVK